MHERPTTSISKADCDGTPVEWPTRIRFCIINCVCPFIQILCIISAKIQTTQIRKVPKPPKMFSAVFFDL